MESGAIPYIFAFGTAAVTVWLVTPGVRYLALRVGLTDRPNERKLHTVPVPRIGGVSIFCGYLCALLLVWGAGWFGVLPPAKEYEVWGVTVGGLVFFAIGLADDLFDLPALGRLLAQLIAAGAAWRVGVRIEFIALPFVGLVSFPPALSLPITAIWLAGTANAINWIDGLDGLAAGVSAIAAAAILVVSLFAQRPEAALIAAALAGGCLGFLRYNFKLREPAEIFMGDGGAYCLGFTLAGVSTIGLTKSTAVAAVVLPYLILAVPILDGCNVILQRLRQGKSPFHPDRGHLHHRLLQAGLSQRGTVLFIYTLTLWMGGLALAVSGMPAGGTYAAISTGLLGWALWQLWSRRRDRS